MFNKHVSPHAESMESAAVTEWCQEENGHRDLCVFLNIPCETWTEGQVKQMLIPCFFNQRVCILDMRGSLNASHTFVLTEWKNGVSPILQGESIQLG